MSFNVILDLFVIACLSSTIIFAVRLNKRLTVLYKSRDELQVFFKQFTDSMEKADAGIKDLRGMGESVFKTAQEQLQAAEALKADLSFLNERGEEIAEKLDVSIREVRGLLKQVEEKKVAPSTVPSAANAHLNSSKQTENNDVVHHLKNVR